MFRDVCRRGCGRAARFAVVRVQPEEGDEDGYGTLEQFVQQNCGSGRIGLGWCGGHPGVVHDDRKGGVLDGERNQPAGLLGVSAT